MWINVPEKLKLWTAYKTAKEALANTYKQQLPSQIVDVAYLFRDLILASETGDVEKTFQTTLSEHYGYDQVERAFTITVRRKTYSVYHNDSQTDVFLYVEERNSMLDWQRRHDLPWRREGEK